MKRAAVVVLAAATAWSATGTAQVSGSVGLGLGTIRYPGGASFSSAILAPVIRHASPTFVTSFSGSLASLPGGVWSTFGRGEAWAATRPLDGGLRFGGELVAAGTSLGDNGSTGAVHGVAEAIWWSGANWGSAFGAGPSAGLITGLGPLVGLHTRARAWWHPSDEPGAPSLQLTVEPTHFPDGWFTDASAGASLERARATLALWATARVSSTFGSKAAGSVFVQWFVTPRLAIEAGGGSTLNDPYQDLPRTAFLAFGVRLHAPPRPPPVPAVPLVPALRGDTQVVRFRMPGAQSVAIAGEWNAWEPTALGPLGDGVWEGTLRLARGLYHFNLLVDGKDWVVPNGVATVPDGMGGIVAVLIVP